MTRRVALVTSAALPDLTEDDRLLVPALARVGVRAEPAVWDAPGVAWDAFDAAVVRSPWDYFLRADAFRAWIDARDRRGPRLVNAAETLRWNLDKRYLGELERAGIPVVPTVYVARGEPADIAARARVAGWTDLVVKPAVSGSAYRTIRVAAGDAEGEATARAILRDGAALIQPYMPEIVDGELSFVVVDGELSHVVRKRPRPGDFRVQSELGGTIERVVADPALAAQARACVAAAPGRPTYARVDGIVRAGRFVVMELEVLEPALYLAHDPEAPDRLAAAIAARVSG